MDYSLKVVGIGSSSAGQHIILTHTKKGSAGSGILICMIYFWSNTQPDPNSRKYLERFARKQEDLAHDGGQKTNGTEACETQRQEHLAGSGG